MKRTLFALLLAVIALLWLLRPMRSPHSPVVTLVSTSTQGVAKHVQRGGGYVEGYGAAKLGVRICQVISGSPSSDYTHGVLSGWADAQGSLPSNSPGVGHP